MSTYASVTETIMLVGAWLKDLIANNVSVPISGSITVDTSALATQASLAALITAQHTDLTSILTRANLLAADTSITTGNGSLASIKADLDTLLTNSTALNAAVATAAKQDTGNTALATLHTDHTALLAQVVALTNANHTDEVALATGIALLHTDSAAILAKQPSTPALEGGNLLMAANYLATLAGIVSGGRALTTEASAAGVLTQITNAAASLVSILAKQPTSPALESGGNLATIAAAAAYMTAPLSLADATATGSPAALASLVAGPGGIIVTALPTNAAGSIVRVSGTDVGTTQGQPLGPGASFVWRVANANQLKIIIGSGSAPAVAVSQA